MNTINRHMSLHSRYLVWVGVFVGIVILSMTTLAHALELKPVANVALYNAQVDVVRDTQARIVYTIANESNMTMRGVRQGVILQAQDGTLTYVTTVNPLAALVLPAQTRKLVQTQFVFPTTLSGTYDVIVTVENDSGALLAQSIAGTVTIGTQKASKKAAALNTSFACALNSARTGYQCTLPTQGTTVTYTVLRGGLLGDMVRKGVAHVATKGDSASLDMSSEQGRFGVRIIAQDAQGNTLAQRDEIYTSPGAWIMASGFTQDAVKNGNITAHLFLDGAGESDARGFVYAVLDAESNVCSSGKLAIQYSVPQERTIVMSVPQGCEKPVMAGFLYDGLNSDGTYAVVTSFGNLSPQDLTRAGKGQRKAIWYRFWKRVQPYAPAVGGGLVVLLILAYGIYTYRKEKITPVLVALFLFAGMSMVVAPVVTHALTYRAYDDASKATMSVSFNKASFLSVDPIGFTFTITNGVSKPALASAVAWVDTGTTTQQIVSTADTKTTYAITLPKVTAGGTHNLHIRIPASAQLCGGFFNASLFSTATFGYKTCDITVPFTVIPNAAPRPPVIGGSCTIGGVGNNTNSVTLSSVDNEKDNVYYQVKFNGTNPIVRVPASGYIASSPTVARTSYTGWNTQGNKTITARATDVQGATSTWKTGTVLCTPQCATTVSCTSGGTTQSALVAKPALIASDTSTTLAWTLSNVTDCSITGTNGDSWSWGSVLSKKSSIRTGKITKETIYTLSCVDFNGTAVSTTTKVRLAPSWSEF